MSEQNLPPQPPDPGHQPLNIQWSDEPSSPLKKQSMQTDGNPQPPLPQAVKLSRRTLIIFGVIVLVLFIIVVASNLNTTNTTTTNTTTTSPTATSQTDSSSPLDATVAAIDATTQANEAVLLANTPIATPTISSQQIEQQTTADAKSAMQFGSNISSSYDPNTKDVIIIETIGESWDNNGAKVSIESDSFNIQQAIWQDSNLQGLTSVEVHILGPLVDKYGNNSTGLVGSCSLNANTEKQFNWGNLDYKIAWDNNDYDQTYLLPSLNS